MLLTEILRPDCIKVPLTSTDKRGAIDELVDLLAACQQVRDPIALKLAVWQREGTRTTGIGHGLAVPHGRSPGCDKLMMAIGRPPKPIEFQSIDGRPVNIIFLLAGPPEQTGAHIQALARISRLMTREEFRASVASATSGQHIYDLIAQSEKVGVE